MDFVVSEPEFLVGLYNTQTLVSFSQLCCFNINNRMHNNKVAQALLVDFEHTAPLHYNFSFSTQSGQRQVLLFGAR